LLLRWQELREGFCEKENGCWAASQTCPADKAIFEAVKSQKKRAQP
jgi:hypothetical protein